MGDNMVPVDLGSDFIPIDIEAGGKHACAMNEQSDIKYVQLLCHSVLSLITLNKTGVGEGIY